MNLELILKSIRNNHFASDNHITIPPLINTIEFFLK